MPNIDKFKELNKQMDEQKPKPEHKSEHKSDSKPQAKPEPKPLSKEQVLLNVVSDALANKTAIVKFTYEVELQYLNLADLLEELRGSGKVTVDDFEIVVSKKKHFSDY